MSVIQEHNLLSFQEFLFSEAWTQTGKHAASEEAAFQSGGKKTKVNANELYREYVNPKTGALDFNSLAVS